MSERLQQMSGQDMSMLREMIHDLNALMRERLEGIPPEQLQSHCQSCLRRGGRIFPDAPATFEEFLEQLQRQLARMDSLMQSLSPEMRRQLGDLMESVFGDAELQAELSQLAGALELLSPRQRLGNRYSFFGGEELPLAEAMDLMGRRQGPAPRRGDGPEGPAAVDGAPRAGAARRLQGPRARRREPRPAPRAA